MRVFLTGGTGFIGRQVLRRLLNQGHEVVALVRNFAKLPPWVTADFQPVQGNLLRPETYQGALAGCEAVIHLVGIIREAPREGQTFWRVHVEGTTLLLEAAKAAGVERFLHMSANGVGPHMPTRYSLTKYEAERRVQESGLHWTIFRPSIVFGPEDAFVNLLRQMFRRFHLVPYFGDGSYLFSPVSVDTVAEAFVRALQTPETEGKILPLCGPEVYPYRELLRLIGESTGTWFLLFPFPVPPVRLAARLLGRLPWFPLSEESLEMLLAGNTCDSDEIYRLLGLEPVSLRAYLEKLRGASR